jgi:hypothetical protein
VVGGGLWVGCGGWRVVGRMWWVEGVVVVIGERFGGRRVW